MDGRGFGPAVVAAIDEAWMRNDQKKLMELARRAAILCAMHLLDGEQDEAMEFARTYQRVIVMSAERVCGGDD